MPRGQMPDLVDWQPRHPGCRKRPCEVYSGAAAYGSVLLTLSRLIAPNTSGLQMELIR